MLAQEAAEVQFGDNRQDVNLEEDPMDPRSADPDVEGSVPLANTLLPPTPVRTSPSLRPDHPWRRSILSPRAALKAKRRAELRALGN